MAVLDYCSGIRTHSQALLCFEDVRFFHRISGDIGRRVHIRNARSRTIELVARGLDRHRTLTAIPNGVVRARMLIALLCFGLLVLRQQVACRSGASRRGRRG